MGDPYAPVQPGDPVEAAVAPPEVVPVVDSKAETAEKAGSDSDKGESTLANAPGPSEIDDGEAEPAIAERISRLQQIQKKQKSQGKTDLDITISHAGTILKLKPEVDDLVKQILSVPTASKISPMINHCIFIITSFNQCSQKVVTSAHLCPLLHSYSTMNFVGATTTRASGL